MNNNNNNNNNSNPNTYSDAAAANRAVLRRIEHPGQHSLVGDWNTESGTLNWRQEDSKPGTTRRNANSGVGAHDGAPCAWGFTAEDLEDHGNDLDAGTVTFSHATTITLAGPTGPEAIAEVLGQMKIAGATIRTQNGLWEGTLETSYDVEILHGAEGFNPYPLARAFLARWNNEVCVAFKTVRLDVAGLLFNPIR